MEMKRKKETKPELNHPKCKYNEGSANRIELNVPKNGLSKSDQE